MQTIVQSIRKVTSIQFTYTLYALAFTIPLFFSSPQIITGTLINCLLFLAALRLSKKEILPLVVLPSLGAIVHGVLFGPQTMFLYYFLPFIWIGNYILIQVFLRLSSASYVSRILISAGAKFLILQLFALMYFRLSIVPSLFVTSMGYIQLMTAIIGGLISYGITTYERH